MQSKISFLIKFDTLLLGIYVFAGYLLPKDELLIISIVALSGFAFLSERKNSTASVDLNTILWCFFIVALLLPCSFFADMVSPIKGLGVLGLYIALKFFLQNTSLNWPRSVMTIVLILNSVYVFATILQLFYPHLIGEINIHILTEKQLQENQRLLAAQCYAGITGQTGINAYNISMLFGVCSCYFLTVKKKRGVVILLIFTLLGLLLTNKRGLLGASAIAVLTVILLYYRFCEQRSDQIFMYGLIAFMLFGIITLLIPQAQNVIVRFFRGGLSGRDIIYNNLISLIQEHPVLGIGYKNFGQYSTITAHNEYLRMLCEGGIIGLIAFICVLIHSFRIPVKAMLKHGAGLLREKQTHLIRFMLFSIYVQVFSLIYATSGNPLSSNDQLMFYMLSVGMGIWATNACKGAQSQN